MLDYFVFSHWALGNTAIQLAAAISITEHLKPWNSYRIQPMFDISNVSSNQISDREWDISKEFILEGGAEQAEIPDHPFLKRLVSGPISQLGYFQDSEFLIEERNRILSRFRSEFGDFPLSKSGITVSEAISAPPPFELRSTDIAIHIRLGDYRKAGWVIDPTAQLAILRHLRKEDPTARIFLVTQQPQTPEEHNYLKLFEEVGPILQCGTELEDFALLRSVPRLIVTNSTFSWVAGWMAEQSQERWIPVPLINNLGIISTTDHLYRATHGYQLERLSIPQDSIQPVTGEFLQSLCDYTVLTRRYKEEMHKWIDLACPSERQLFTGEEWPSRVYLTAKSLFVYPDVETLEAILRISWPALRLLVIHNGDNTVPQVLLNRFLDAHPNAYAWVQNAVEGHPRQRILPIGLENRIWRNGRREILDPQKEMDLPIQISRPTTDMREFEILVTHCGPTNPIRAEWASYLKGEGRRDTRMYCMPKMDFFEYEETLPLARAVLCPPGNGHDTHRAWEVLQCGGYPILLDSPHTRLLKAQYPSLPLLSISTIQEIHSLEIPSTSPSEFHPLLLREYWKILFNSHLESTNEK